MGSSQTELGGLSGAVVRTIREPLLILDENLRISTANPAFYRTFQTDPENTLGNALFDLGNGQWNIPELRQRLEQVLSRGEPVEGFEVAHDFVPLGRRHLVVDARRLESGGDEPPLILIALQDITALVEAQAELQRSNQELERFAYIASHDLQEPLRMVASYTRLLARRYQGKLDDRADKYIRYAVEGAERMKMLIQDLLAFSRIGSQPVTPVPTDADQVLDQVLQDFRIKVQTTGARVTHDALPRLRVDPSQLRQLFQNLLENALKFGGDAPPRVHISGHRDGAWCHIEVRDEGIGIAPEYLEQVFVIFQRLHGREQEGTGIGLAVCRRIVERHGGRLWVDSAPGEGATFHFTLPSAGS